ncbi:MAG: hypothetical protein WAZ18_03065 [Alphaproteobacteria bacterium]
MKRMRTNVPVDEINDVADAVEGIVSIYQIERKIEQDAKIFKLTPEEVVELRNAYVLEDVHPVMVDRFRQAQNKVRERVGKPPLRSSQEILEGVQNRVEKPVEYPNGASEPADIRTGPSSDGASTTVIYNPPPVEPETLPLPSETHQGDISFPAGIVVGASTDIDGTVAPHIVCQRCHRLIHQRYKTPEAWQAHVARYHQDGAWFTTLSLTR